MGPNILEGSVRDSSWKAKWIWKAGPQQINDFAYFRKEISVRHAVRQARLYVSAHHFFQVFVNGNRIGGFGSPAPSDPGRTKYYLAYDLTAMMKEGVVCLGAIAHYLGGNGQNYVNGHPGFWLQAEIAYANGKQETWVSDATWDVLKEIPHRIGAPYQQNRRISAVEDYDERKHDPAWLLPGYDPSLCENAVPAHPDTAGWPLCLQTIPEGVIEEIIEPAEVPIGADALPDPTGGGDDSNPQLFDAGRIVSGWPRLTLRGIPGVAVTMRYAEALDERGRVAHKVCNERSDSYYDRLTMSGTENLQWEPNLSYKAFRFVEVTGYPEKLTGENVQIAAAHTAMSCEGSFACSAPLLNELYEACIRTQKNNVLGQVVDCPHREQAQYLADSDLQAETLIYNFAAQPVLEKVLSDFADAQLENGTFPFVVPSNYEHKPFHLQIPEWDSHFFTLLWKTYWAYGDTRMLARFYPAAKRLAEHYTREIDPETGLKRKGAGWHISDWPHPTVVHEGDFLTAENIKACEGFCLMAKMADILGQEADRDAFAVQADRLKDRIRSHLFDAAVGRFRDSSGTDRHHQGVNALAEQCGLFTETERKALIPWLADGPWEARTVLSLSLLRSLFDNGRPDAAYRLLNRTEFPGWGYMIAQGAKTMWEGWQDIESHCHAWNGYPARLLQEYIAGIQALSPGFAEVLIQPYLPADLAYAEAAVSTCKGIIRTRWERGEGDIRLSVELPQGASARVVLPVSTPAAAHILMDDRTVWQNGRFVMGEPGVERGLQTGSGISFDIKSGTYDFQILSKNKIGRLYR